MVIRDEKVWYSLREYKRDAEWSYYHFIHKESSGQACMGIMEMNCDRRQGSFLGDQKHFKNDWKEEGISISLFAFYTINGGISVYRHTSQFTYSFADNDLCLYKAIF
jgi:hypothetical protein